MFSLTETRVSTLIPAAFMLFYACLITDFTGNFLSNDDAYSLIYNYYFLSLVDGRFDVPLRIIGKEGHYLLDGTAYVYYGILPAFLRGLFHPFVDLGAHSVARIVIWVVVCASALLLQGSSLRLLGDSLPQRRQSRIAVIAGVLVAIWLVSPIAILAANASIYHEPIAIAFFLTSLAIYLAIRFSQAERPLALVISVSVVAGLCVLVRPNIAVSLYVFACFLAMQSFLSGVGGAAGSFMASARRFILTPGLIMLLFGLSFLYLNYLRFGSATTVHGTIDGPLYYGLIFLGYDDPATSNVVAFERNGRFNLLRIIPNTLFHAIGGYNLHERLLDTFDVGTIRKEAPFAPALVLFAPWVLFSIAGLVALVRKQMRAQLRAALGPAARLIWPLVALVSIQAIFILAYGTITLRYKTEFWLLLCVLSVFGLQQVLSASSGNLRAGLLSAGGAALVLGGVYSGVIALQYADKFSHSNTLSREQCLLDVAASPFGPGMTRDVCAQPARGAF